LKKLNFDLLKKNVKIPQQTDKNNLSFGSVAQIQILPDTKSQYTNSSTSETRILLQSINNEVIEIYKTCDNFQHSKNTTSQEECLSIPLDLLNPDDKIDINLKNHL